VRKALRVGPRDSPLSVRRLRSSARCARAHTHARRRREQHETSGARVKHLLHEARKAARRLAGAVRGEDEHLRALLQLAYGLRGRVMHVQQRARALVRGGFAASWSLSLADISRLSLSPCGTAQWPQGKGPLAALPYPLPSAEECAGRSSSVALLVLRVPPCRVLTGAAGGTSLLLRGLTPPQHRPDWESEHCVLLEARFWPELGARAAEAPRHTRRLYESIFALQQPRLRIATIPGDGDGDGDGNGTGALEGELRFQGRTLARLERLPALQTFRRAPRIEHKDPDKVTKT